MTESGDVGRVQMEMQQVTLDSFEEIEADGSSVGYIDTVEGGLFINASVIMDIAKSIQHQGNTSESEDVRYVLYLAALAVAEGIKMTHQHIVGVDIDTMFN